MAEFEREHIARMLIDAEDVGDIGAYVQGVLRESYIEATQDLQRHADRVRCVNELKRRIREALSDLYDARASAATDGDLTTEVVGFDCVRRGDGWAVEQTHAATVTAVADLDRHIAELEIQLESLGDDAELANFRLQTLLQRQTQLMQTLSNVSKMLHDSQMGIIRNLR